MRIIGGRLSGRVFHPPLKKSQARPTTDKAKEAVYNILNAYIDLEGVVALDLFSGFGNHTYEIVSRGGKLVTSVEKNRKNTQFINETAENLGIASHVVVVEADVFKFLETQNDSYDLIIADPPYDNPRLPQLPDVILEYKELLNPDGIFVLEHGRTHNFEFMERCIDSRRYGNAYFSFFR